MTDANLRQFDWLNNLRGEWMKSKQVEALSEQKKKEAWDNFTKSFPNADLSKFEVQVVLYSKTHVEATVYFKAGDGFGQNVFGSDRKYWSAAMKKALGVEANQKSFPLQLQPAKSVALPVPSIDFEENPASLKKVFESYVDVFVTQTESFKTKFRPIFQNTKLRHTSAKESKKWLSAPNMTYWPQQLNFAVWAATTGSGISREIFDKERSSLLMPKFAFSFYRFHVYFTIRRILFQMGGIQSEMSLPGDPNFDEKNNIFDNASYRRLCAEFGISSSTDFRFKKPKNHGLCGVYEYGQGAFEVALNYPGGSAKFSDEGGSANKGNLIYFIEPDSSSERQADWFCSNTSQGLTQAGLARINQSIEAFVYCVLGAQVNVRSSILGSGGRAKEAQTEFLVLVEDALRQPDLSKSVQRYQLAIDQAKARLNFAICPGAWLMPGNMVINTSSTVGYNNKLQQAGQGMKLGVNNDVNTETSEEKKEVKKMGGGPSKIIPISPDKKVEKAKPKPTGFSENIKKKEPADNTQHEINKYLLAIGAVVLVGFAFMTKG